jgi:hypothetical protein
LTKSSIAAPRLKAEDDDMICRASALPLLIWLILGTGVMSDGCSSSTTTHTVERPVTDEAGATHTETTTTETHEVSGPGVGIISGTVHVIGVILALPFRLVGGLIELIF